MLAYVFWHAPARAEGYEDGLRAFHAALAEDPPEGFVRSASYRVDVPWLGAGYEDWYLVETWHGLGVLNAAAVDARRAPTHDPVAHASAKGAGGVYRHVAGEAQTDGEALWTPRSDQGEGARSVWMRQMVLGPSPEYCVFEPGADAGVARERL